MKKANLIWYGKTWINSSSYGNWMWAEKKSLLLSWVINVLYGELILQHWQTEAGEDSESGFVTVISLTSLSLGKLLQNINHVKKEEEEEVCFILDTNEGESCKSYERSYPCD